MGIIEDLRPPFVLERWRRVGSCLGLVGLGLGGGRRGVGGGRRGVGGGGGGVGGGSLGLGGGVGRVHVCGGFFGGGILVIRGRRRCQCRRWRVASGRCGRQDGDNKRILPEALVCVWLGSGLGSGGELG